MEGQRCLLIRNTPQAVVPDLHTVPGGQNPDWHSDNGTGYTLFWQYGVFRQQMVMLWKEIVIMEGQRCLLIRNTPQAVEI